MLLHATVATTVTDIENMRARDLRRFLIKFGFDEKEVSTILDKSELKKLAQEALWSKQHEAETIAFNKKAFYWTIAALGIVLIFILWEPLKEILRFFRTSLSSAVYQIKSKFKLLRVCLENYLFLGALGFALAMIIEIIEPLMQISVIASWILPSGSPFRRFLFPWPNLPLSLDTVVGLATGGTKGAVQGMSTTKSALGNFGSFGVNLGPMVTIWACTWAKNRLENFGASFLMGYADEKNRRRQERAKKKSEKERGKATTPDWAKSDEPVCDFVDGKNANSNANDDVQRGASRSYNRREFKLGGDSDRVDDHDSSKASVFDAAPDDGDFWADDAAADSSHNDHGNREPLNSTGVADFSTID
jgi:hypothetical protein